MIEFRNVLPTLTSNSAQSSIEIFSLPSLPGRLAGTSASHVFLHTLFG